MNKKVGIISSNQDFIDSLTQFLQKKGILTQTADVKKQDQIQDVLIVDLSQWSKNTKQFLLSVKRPILFVSRTDEDLTLDFSPDEFERAEFVEVDIKDGIIYPEFVFFFKLGILLKIGNFVHSRKTPREIEKKKQMKPETQGIRQTRKLNIPKNAKNALIIVGSSAGGPGTLLKLLSKISKPTPPIVLVQHITHTFAKPLADRLNDRTPIEVVLAEENDVLQANTAYLAPPGKHMELTKFGNSLKIKLTDGPRVNFVKPAVDVTLFSAARLKDYFVISTILTGMGRDGMEGSKVIKRQGGAVIALNEKDSVVYGMNRSVIEANLADFILPLNEIPRKLRELTQPFL